MDVEQTRDGDVVILRPPGSLSTPQECGTLRRTVWELLEAKVQLFVVDCCRVEQMGAEGVRTLLRIERKLSALGGRIVLCGIRAKVGKAFALSGFDRDFCIVASQSEAVRELTRSAATPTPHPPSRHRSERVAALAAMALGLELSERTGPPEDGSEPDDPMASRLRNVILGALATDDSA